MGRLIDADAYKDYLCRNCVDVGFDFYGARDISRCPCGKVLDIEYRPTAYDVDKVIEDIKTKSMMFVDPWVSYEFQRWATDIVKRGVIDG